MLTTWLAAGRPAKIKLSDASTFDIKSHLKNGIIAGTNSDSISYWGNFQDLDQRAVEAADIALTLWLLIDKLDEQFKRVELDRIKNWLNQINEKQIHGGNWHLFRLIVNTVLLNLGDNSKVSSIENDYSEFKSYYVGDGWFTDGKGGNIDYYNAWQMQYFLFWFSEIKPNHDQEFINQVFTLFSSNYKYFISMQGLPIWGRSSCYRLAAPVPLIINSFKKNDGASTAKRSLDAIWAYFIEKGALSSGTVTQGYCGKDTELLENYSGRGSCLWSLRSLVLAFYQPKESGLWLANDGLLPIEKESYSIFIKGPQLNVIGNKNTHEIIVEQLHPLRRSEALSEQPLKKMPLWRSIAEQFLRRPLRLDNFEVKYGRKQYSNLAPFCECVLER